MAMLDIEYRFRDEPLGNTEIRRKNVKSMESYMRDLVFEMQSADISVKFTTAEPKEGERNMVYINGRSVPSILVGLDIKIPEPEEDTCGCDSPQKTVPLTIGGPNISWNEDYIEDIPDILMKNAIAKMFADMNRNRIDLNNIE